MRVPLLKAMQQKCGIGLICYLHETGSAVLFRWDKKEYQHATALLIQAPRVDHVVDLRRFPAACFGICA